ncbi:MAG: hypothetical protein WDW38_002047 [Sanguina aurantia]
MAKTKKPTKGAAKVRDETDDERRIRLEMEALAADEADRRKQENSRVALRERQAREQRYSHLNGIKIHNQWRKIMRMAKVEELRREIEVLSQNHEREVDRKDAIMQMLDRDLEEAEEQYALAVRGHMVVVEGLLDLQFTRIKALEAHFAADLRALDDEFETERTEIVNAHSRQKKDLADLTTAMEAEFADAQNDLRQEFESQREEVKNRSSEEYNVLKIQLEGIIEELERHFEQAHKAYLDGTDHRTTAFRMLTRNDAGAARVIEKRMRKLIKLQESLQHWRTKIATNSAEWDERNRALRHEKEIMTRHYGGLKASMDASRAGQAGRLRALSLDSNAAMASLRGKLDCAENILKLSELSRKYETEHEKPPLSSATATGSSSGRLRRGKQTLEGVTEGEGEESQGTGSGIGSEGLGAGGGKGGGGGRGAPPSVGSDGQPNFSAAGLDPDGVVVEEWDYLNRFFKRTNKALLDKSAIDKEKARLERENADLRSILKQYLDGISVNDDVLNNPVNPLMVVNNRLQITLTERNKARAQAANNSRAPGAPRPLLVEVQATSRVA